MCNQLIECLARMKSKSDECKASSSAISNVDELSNEESTSSVDAVKVECKQNAKRMHAELTSLHEQKSTQYETCLREKATQAVPIENTKKVRVCYWISIFFVYLV